MKILEGGKEEQRFQVKFKIKDLYNNIRPALCHFQYFCKIFSTQKFHVCGFLWKPAKELITGGPAWLKVRDTT